MYLYDEGQNGFSFLEEKKLSRFQSILVKIPLSVLPESYVENIIKKLLHKTTVDQIL